MDKPPFRNDRPSGPRRPGAPGAYNGPGKGRPFTARPSGPRRDGPDRPERSDRFSARSDRDRPAPDDDFTPYERERADSGPARGGFDGARDDHDERPPYARANRDHPGPSGREGAGDRPVRPAQYSKAGPPPGRKPTWSPRPEGPGKDEMIFGIRPVQEALLAGQALERVFVQRELKSPLGADVLEAARKLNVPVQEVPVEKLNALTRKNHQGVVAMLSVIDYAPLQEVITAAFEAGRTPLVVVLDRVTDVRNFGSIARSAECLGADAILVPNRGGAQINGDAVKTSAGALSRLPVCREPNLKEALRYLADAGLRIVACTEKASATLGQPGAPDLSGPLALILGSEEDGISPEYLRLADAEVRIPVLGHINSLNVSVAAGVALFEVQRQRGA
ncbi:MAG: 23S rRNA (guanosine(2251)-2'-O)-methyltransferase RlmB [Hymenobacteraceae bacterium]|nr:23S rRNA (guanosine(2251)-2'-O)-methyltransferase RlmB [Hymenobacteraceae bacterium]